VANAHETNCYLLQQRVRDPKGQPGLEREPVNFDLVGELGKTASSKTSSPNEEKDIVHLLLTVGKAVHYDDIENRFYPSGTTSRSLEALEGEGTIYWNPSSEMIYLRNPGKAKKEYGHKRVRLAFNKYNAPELIGQLLTVLKKEGLKDAENQIRMKKIPQLIEKAWSERDAAERLAATWFGRTSTDSGAGSAEGHFFDNPERREVREFHDTGAVSNDPAAAAQSVENMEEYTEEAKAPSGDVTSPADAAQAAKAAPPTPAEIRELPGDAAVSTLNRYIIKTEEPVTGVPESRDDLPKHPEEGAKVGRAWRVMKEEN